MHGREQAHPHTGCWLAINASDNSIESLHAATGAHTDTLTTQLNNYVGFTTLRGDVSEHFSRMGVDLGRSFAHTSKLEATIGTRLRVVLGLAFSLQVNKCSRNRLVVLIQNLAGQLE